MLTLKVEFYYKKIYLINIKRCETTSFMKYYYYNHYRYSIFLKLLLNQLVLVYNKCVIWERTVFSFELYYLFEWVLNTTLCYIGSLHKKSQQ